jgi:hypothetical protein
MNNRLSFGLGIAAGLAAMLVFQAAKPTTAQMSDSSETAPESQHPYVVMSGQVGSNFQVFYVLDQVEGKLAVFRWTEVKGGELETLGGRNLARDFNRPSGGAYAMAKVQLGKSRGLLAVTDNASDRVIIYRVDVSRNTIEPVKSERLDKIFR